MAVTANVIQNENVSELVPPTGDYQAGVSNLDTGEPIENGVKLPYPQQPSISWLYYNCWLEFELDAGIVTHRHLPQSDPNPDTLGVIPFDATALETTIGGVNTKTLDSSFNDFSQRMAHSVYRFCLKGNAIRVGLQVPIPTAVGTMVANCKPIPDDERPQRAFNKLVANYGGFPVFYAEWELWYTVTVPPTQQQLPPQNPASKIVSDQIPPTDGIQVPFTVPDPNAVTTIPPLLNPI